MSFNNLIFKTYLLFIGLKPRQRYYNNNISFLVYSVIYSNSKLYQIACFDL